MRHLKLCLKCRGKLEPNNGTKVGAWYCPRCDYCFTQIQIESAIVNQPGGKIETIGPRK